VRAAVVRTVGGPDAVEVLEVPRPVPGPGQVLIKVSAAGLNPADAGVWRGLFGPPPEGSHLGLGWDVAGTIADVGWGPGNLSVGDPVIAIVKQSTQPVRAQAEYVAVDVFAVAAAPSLISPILAATLPLNTLTAATMLDPLALRAGQTLLVAGAAGAVGGFAVQLARVAGVKTIALGRASDEELLTTTLGATWFVDRDDDLAAAVRRISPGGVDAVVDAAMIGEPLLAALRDGGRYSIANPVEGPAPERGIEVYKTSVAPDGRRLAEMSHLADVGLLTPRVAETFPLDDAAKAHARLVEGGLRGRLVLVP